ncbi:hypothetical protein I6E29_07925 [Arcanobacterium haemolyticum]|nr:hypothetical protein [Arcanobacterium haemolyticum]
MVEASARDRSYSLIFVTARWCDPAVPMRVIFDETLRDLSRLRPDVPVRGIVVDVDDEEQNHLVPAEPPLISPELLAEVDFVPMILLVEDDEAEASGVGEVLSRGSTVNGPVLVRLVGQLPKLVIRQKILEELDR